MSAYESVHILKSSVYFEDLILIFFSSSSVTLAYQSLIFWLWTKSPYFFKGMTMFVGLFNFQTWVSFLTLWYKIYNIFKNPVC